jgi:uncharacterized damage-inducible protein DinB
MADISQIFLQESRKLLLSEYLPKIEQCVARLSDEDIWWRPNEASNSIGNLLLHLSGNVSQWILNGVGGQAFERHRQQEFDERRRSPGRDLIAKLRGVLDAADAVLAIQDERTLQTRRHIQGYDVTVLEAIYHVVEHFGMHTGQIIWMTKARTAEDLKLWRPPQEEPARE